MLNIAINLDAGVARLSQPTSIKAGGGVPVTITFAANPGTDPVIELALSPQSSTPEVLAYLGTFAAQSSTVYTGTLDANDTRLINHLFGKQQETLDCEVVVTIGEAERQPLPNFQVTCQPPVITGPESSEGGPVYLTESLSDARYAAKDQNLADLSDFATARDNLGLVPGADIIAYSEKAAPEGVATLDSGGRVPTSQLPDSVLGQVEYQGGWNASSNSPSIPSASAGNKGWYYVVTTAGSTNISGVTDWKIGDWLVSNGTTWDKIDNTEPVADESTVGMSARASTAEAQAASNDTKHLTPLKGKALLDQRLATTTEGNQQRSTTQLITPALLRSQTTANASATVTLTAASDLRQILAPQTTDRDVILPEINATPTGNQVGYGHVYEILHDGAANSLVVKNFTSTVMARIDVGENASFIATSSGWIVTKNFRAGPVTIIFPGIYLTAAAASTTIYTPITGITFHPVAALLRNDTVGGTISTPAQAQIDNGTNGNDLFASLTLTSPATGRAFPFSLATQPFVVDASNPLRLRRTVAASGTSPVHTGTLLVTGILY